MPDLLTNLIITPAAVVVMTGLLFAVGLAGVVMAGRLTPTGSISRAQVCVLALGGALAWALKLSLIDRFGSSLPFWDQWIAEGANLYRPFLRGELQLADLFAPHNEHRIFTTRVADLFLLLVNGQWDARLQMAANGLVHVLVVLMLTWMLWQAADRRSPWWFALTGFVFAVVPFGWVNTLAGFQLQFYLLLLFSIIAIHAWVNLGGWASLCLALVAGLLAVFSMGSGLLAAAACAPVILHAAWRPAGPGRRPALLAGLTCLVVLGLGAAAMAAAPVREILHARDPIGFLRALGYTLGWPLPVPFALLIVWLPWGLDAAKMLRSPWRPLSLSDRTMLALGLWVLLQGAAIAYARSGESPHPNSRFIDLLAPGLIVNLAALCRLRSTSATSQRPAWPAVAWLAVIIAALLPCATGSVLIDCVRVSNYYAAQGRYTRQFLATGDARILQGKALLDLPYPDPAVLAGYLQDPIIRSLLPPPWQDPAADLARSGPGPAGFNLDDFDPFEPPMPNAPARGTFSRRLLPGPRQWRSAAFPAIESGWLYWEIAGYPTRGTTLLLQQADGTSVTGRFRENPKQQWRHLITSAPKSEWHLNLTEAAGNQWVAVRGPWKLGLLSGWLLWLLSGLDYLLFGLAFALACLLLPRQPPESAGPPVH